MADEPLIRLAQVTKVFYAEDVEAHAVALSGYSDQFPLRHEELLHTQAGRLANAAILSRAISSLVRRMASDRARPI